MVVDWVLVFRTVDEQSRSNNFSVHSTNHPVQEHGTTAVLVAVEKILSKYIYCYRDVFRDVQREILSTNYIYINS